MGDVQLGTSSVQLGLNAGMLDYPNALVDSVGVKAGAADSEHRCVLCAFDSRDDAVCKVAGNGKHVVRSDAGPLQEKCINPATGEPVTARRDDTAVMPVDGSVGESPDGNGKGSCPLCMTLVKLSGKGYLTAHTVRGERIPVPKTRLTERQAVVTDSGARVGSPDVSERARTAEITGVMGTGTVRVKVVVKDGAVRASVPDAVTGKRTSVDVENVSIEMIDPANGERQTIEVPNTVQNIRTALRQELGKKQRPERKKSAVPGEDGCLTGRMTGGPDQSVVNRLSRMLKGATGLEVVGAIGAKPGCYNTERLLDLSAKHVPQGGRDEGKQGDRVAHVPSILGPALVQGPDTSCAVPTERDRTTSKGKPRNAIGWSGPTGRERPDRVAVGGKNASVCRGKGCAVEGCEAIVGGEQHGHMPCHVFRQLGKSKRGDYWAVVSKSKRAAKAARESAKIPARKAQSEIERLRVVGEALPVRGW